ncbi:TetR family transcriptional regulator [Microtetraspora sp. NBRC 13810]|nr:TetR family transcriptional regulator [Microtetraspora sp. NBRC 13810]
MGQVAALLNEALVQAMAEWGEELESALAAGDTAGATPAQRFEAAWSRIVESFARLGPLWAIQFELVAQMDRMPEVREAFAAATRRSRLGLAALFHDLDPDADEEKALALGGFYQALLAGLATQYLVDPKSAISAAALTEALAMITAEWSGG